MKISLYPTADGCYRPSRVAEKAGAWLDAGNSVVIASSDVMLAGLEGAVVLKRIGDLRSLQDDPPRFLVVDALDFTDPGGREIISRLGYPQNLPELVTGCRFLEMLKELARGITEEVLLVSVNCDISGPWLDRLHDLGVQIEWGAAASDPWRRWTQGKGDTDIHIKTAGAGPGQPGAPGNTAMATCFHGSRPQMLLTLAAEYADIHLSGSGRVPAAEPVQVLVRMLAGKPVSDRLEMCGHLLEDLKLLTLMVQDLHRTLNGPGRASAGAKAPAMTAVSAAPGFPKRTLH